MPTKLKIVPVSSRNTLDVLKLRKAAERLGHQTIIDAKVNRH